MEEILQYEFGPNTEESKRQMIEKKRAQRAEEEKLPNFFTEDFGPWRFDTEDLCLIHKEGDYVIPLERITTSACLLDWIMQVNQKAWADPLTIFSLLVALRRILDPQANYCPFEEDRRVDGNILARYYAEKTDEKREENLTIQKSHLQAEAIIELLKANQQTSLSLLIESVDFSSHDVLETLKSLEQRGIISFDRQTKYVQINDAKKKQSK